MKIKLHEIPVRDVADGYVDSAENGVVGYGGRLNIRLGTERRILTRGRTGWMSILRPPRNWRRCPASGRKRRWQSWNTARRTDRSARWKNWNG